MTPNFGYPEVKGLYFKANQLEYAIPQSTIASLSAGEVVCFVADNPDQCIPQKMFHGQIKYDFAALEKEETGYDPLSDQKKDEKIIRETFLRVKREAKAIVAHERD